MAGRKLSETDAEPGPGQARPTTQYAYDRNGDLIYVTDPRGNTTQYVYNDLGRKTAVIPPPANPTAISPVTMVVSNPVATGTVSGLTGGAFM